MRIDVREALERAAAEELRFNDCYVALVSREVAESMTEPSGPFRVAAVVCVGHPIIDLVFESVGEAT